MSLVNVFATSDRVVILTDTSLYDDAGRIMGFSEKCFAVDSWTGAFSFRGNAWGAAALAFMVEQFGSFDEFVAGSAPEIQRQHRAALAEGRLFGQQMIELHVAGWSEREDRARAFVLRSPGFLGDHLAPYAWSEVEGAWHLDFDLLALWRLARQDAEPGEDWTPETFDVHRHAVPLAEEQRRLFAEGVAEFAGLRVIGGSLRATTLTREGVIHEVLKDWPDAVGEPIQPTPWDHDGMPWKVPCGIPWSFEKFQRALAFGVLDIRTFAVNHERLSLMEALDATPTPAPKPPQPKAVPVASAPPRPAAGLWQPPVDKAPTRDQRRAAKAQTRKASAHA